VCGCGVAPAYEGTGITTAKCVTRLEYLAVLESIHSSHRDAKRTSRVISVMKVGTMRMMAGTRVGRVENDGPIALV
jgi:hypothetical protein